MEYSEVPDVTTDPAEWLELRPAIREDGSSGSPLWKNVVYEDVYSTDGGKTFTISTEREHPDIPRIVRESRKV